MIYFLKTEVTMFDNLRDDATSQPFYEEEEAKFQPTTDVSGSRPSRFLGMTSIQRFVISVMLFFTVCVIGALCLLVTNKIGF
jgi:hypothetical protein